MLENDGVGSGVGVSTNGWYRLKLKVLAGDLNEWVELKI